jgi:hypothetical protein
MRHGTGAIGIFPKHARNFQKACGERGIALLEYGKTADRHSVAVIFGKPFKITMGPQEKPPHCGDLGSGH